MSDTATVPTDEQLKNYAAELPDLYKDILAAYPFVNDARRDGDGVFESSLRNFLRNLGQIKPADMHWVLRSGPVGRHPYKFTRAVDEYTDDEFSAAVDRLIEYGFISPRVPNGLGLLTPTPIGERLIHILAGKPESRKDLPELPKPLWH